MEFLYEIFTTPEFYVESASLNKTFWFPKIKIISRETILIFMLFSIAEKCFDIWGILKMATVKSVEPGNIFLA